MNTSSIFEQSRYNLAGYDPQSLWQHTNGEGIKIAVLDTGVDPWHPALRNNIKECRSFTRDGAETDEDGHGTMLAGVITASKCSGPMHGIARGAELYIGKVVRNATGGVIEDLLHGIEWAIAIRANIICVCLTNSSPIDEIHSVIRKAILHGAFVICAAGNTGRDGVGYPARYDECLAVGAVTKLNHRWIASACGSGVDVVAFGERVRSTCPTYINPTGYSVNSGTSIATSLVTGVVALGLAKQNKYPVRDPIKNQYELLTRLRQTAKSPVETIPNDEYGYGVIDPKAFLDSI